MPHLSVSFHIAKSSVQKIALTLQEGEGMSWDVIGDSTLDEPISIWMDSYLAKEQPIILENAVENGFSAQSIGPERLKTPGPFTVWECAPSVLNHSEPKSCTDQPSSTAFSRIIALPLSMESLPPFTALALQTLSREVPFGQVVTYGELAKLMGRPGAARGVGNACGRNPFPLVIPCHRVVASGGRIGGFSLDPSIKSYLLRYET